MSAGDRFGGAGEADEARVESGIVAHARVARFLERRRADHDEPGRDLRELEQELLVGRRERLGRLGGVQRLHLPEPSDHGGRPGALQVGVPSAPGHHAVLSEDRVALPAEVAELRGIRAEAGRQRAFQPADRLFDDHVFRPGEHDHIVRVGVKPSGREGCGASPGGDSVGQAADGSIRRHLFDGCSGVREELQLEIFESGAAGATRGEFESEGSARSAGAFLLIVLHRHAIHPRA